MNTSFPWRENDWQTLLAHFDGSEAFSVRWPWATFHETAFRALKFAALKPQFSLDDALNSLSWLTPAKNQLTEFKNLGLLDGEERIVALDPTHAIRESLKMASGDIQAFGRDDLILPTLDKLLSLKPEILTTWSPVFSEEITTLSNWLSKKEAHLEAFQGASPWVQLALFENLVGVTKPWTLLNFQRIYSEVT